MVNQYQGQPLLLTKMLVLADLYIRTALTQLIHRSPNHGDKITRYVYHPLHVARLSRPSKRLSP